MRIGFAIQPHRVINSCPLHRQKSVFLLRPSEPRGANPIGRNHGRSDPQDLQLAAGCFVAIMGRRPYTVGICSDRFRPCPHGSTNPPRLQCSQALPIPRPGCSILNRRHRGGSSRSWAGPHPATCVSNCACTSTARKRRLSIASAGASLTR